MWVLVLLSMHVVVEVFSTINSNYYADTIIVATKVLQVAK